MKKKFIRLCFLFVVGLVLQSPAVDAQSSGFTRIDFPGAQGTAAWGINDAGQISGYYSTVGLHGHGFLLEADFTLVDVPEARGTTVHGINNAGQIVGDYGEEGNE